MQLSPSFFKDPIWYFSRLITNVITLGSYDPDIDLLLRKIIKELDTDVAEDVYPGRLSGTEISHGLTEISHGLMGTSFEESSLTKNRTLGNTDKIIDSSFFLTICLSNGDIVSFWSSNKFYGYATDIKYYYFEDMIEHRLSGSAAPPIDSIYKRSCSDDLGTRRKKDMGYGNWITLKRLDRAIKSFVKRNQRMFDTT